MTAPKPQTDKIPNKPLLADEGEMPHSLRAWDKGFFLAARLLATEAEFTDLIKNSRWDHYVYGLCLDNGAVFYVGKGVRNRALDHAKSAASGNDSEKCRYIRAIGDRLRYTIFFQCSDDAFARGYEAHLILNHKDVLTNIAPASQAAFMQMLQPVDLYAQALDDLDYIDEYVKRADAECRAAMQSIIAKCPGVKKSMTEEEISWTYGEFA